MPRAHVAVLPSNSTPVATQPVTCVEFWSGDKEMPGIILLSPISGLWEIGAGGRMAAAKNLRAALLSAADMIEGVK